MASTLAMLLTTALYCAIHFLEGVIVSSLGPSIEELARGLSRAPADFAVCFTARGLGYLPGVLIGGKICDAFPQHGHRSMLLLLLVIAGMNALVPAAGSLPLLVAAFAVVGVSLGGVNTVLNAHMSWLWGAKLAPYMHAMHTAFALGAFIAPVLLGESFAIVSKEGGGASTASSGFRQHVARMGPPYWGVSVAMAVAALLLARAMPPERLGGGDVQQKQQKQREHCEPTRSEAGGCVVIPSEGSPADTEPPSTPQRPPLAAKVAPLSIDSDSTSASTASPVAVGSDERPTPLPCAFALGMLLFAYVGAEVGTGGWVLEYAIIRKLMTERRASYLVACFWGCLAAGRLASVFVSRCMTARTLLFGGICGCFVPLLVLAAAPDSVPAVWLAVGVYGFLLAPLFAAVMSLPVELGFKHSGKSTGVICFLASAGEMLIPFIIGELFRISTLWMARVCLACAAMMLVVYVTALAMFRRAQASLRYLPVRERPIENGETV